MNETPEFAELLQNLDEMVDLLDAHHQNKAPAIRAQFDAVVEGLKKERSLLAAEFAKETETTEKMLAAARAARESAKSERKSTKDAASQPKAPKAPAAPSAEAASIDPELGARLRQELLVYLGETCPKPPPTSSPASFTQWAMASSSMEVLSRIEPTTDINPRWGRAIADLSDRRVVWWACIAVAEAMRLGNRQLPPDELSALETATRWVLAPSLAAKAEMAQSVASLQDSAIGQSLGQAVAVADRDSPGQSAAGAAQAAERAARALLPEAQRPAYVVRCKEIAAAVADGRAMWPNIVTSPEKKPVGDFQAWLSQSVR